MVDISDTSGYLHKQGVLPSVSFICTSFFACGLTSWKVELSYYIVVAAAMGNSPSIRIHRIQPKRSMDIIFMMHSIKIVREA